MVNIKTEKEITLMHEGGRILHAILSDLQGFAKAGITTEEIDVRARELIKQNNVTPSFLGYRGYPAVICTSINEELVHSIPSKRKLKDGDLLKLDFGVVHGGFHTDSAVTILIGKPGKKDKEKLKLIDVTREALMLGIEQAKIGNKLGDIGSAIQQHVQKNGFNVARELVGHGIGRSLHEAPYVPNYGRSGEGLELKDGMTIAIEPIVMAGKWHMQDAPDGHGYVTTDGSLAAHFEHTLAITKSGPLILT